ncbi:MAG: RNA polymerase sigma factor [Acidimicrobiales bacterium]
MIEEVDITGRIDLLRSGDATAWEELYRSMYPAMVSYARRRLPADEARDAVAEAIERALTRPDRLPSAPVAPEAWIFGILRHVVLDVLRRSSRGLRALRRSVASSTEWAEPAEGIISTEEHRSVRRAFDQLSPRDREILELRVVGGLSAEDAGRVLGMREGAVRNAQYRAVRRLRQLFDEGPLTEERP